MVYVIAKCKISYDTADDAWGWLGNQLPQGHPSKLRTISGAYANMMASGVASILAAFTRNKQLHHIKPRRAQPACVGEIGESLP